MRGRGRCRARRMVVLFAAVVVLPSLHSPRSRLQPVIARLADGVRGGPQVRSHQAALRRGTAGEEGRQRRGHSGRGLAHILRRLRVSAVPLRRLREGANHHLGGQPVASARVQDHPARQHAPQRRQVVRQELRGDASKNFGEFIVTQYRGIGGGLRVTDVHIKHFPSPTRRRSSSPPPRRRQFTGGTGRRPARAAVEPRQPFGAALNRW
jgi:hypothetical protein